MQRNTMIIAMLVLVLSSFVFGNDLDPDSVLIIPKVENGSITLDAQMTEPAWAEVLTSEISDSSTIDDYYCLFGVLYDDMNLYLYFKITDDWLDYKKNDWNTDAVEIYVDGDDSKMDTWDNIDDYQVTVPLGAEAVEEWAGTGPANPYPRENITYGVTETFDGWDTEIALPFDDFMFADYFGFDIALNDADDTEARENQVWFLGSGSWNVPSSWGEAFLSGVMVNVKNSIQNIKDFKLEQNYPNPFNPTTQIPFILDKRVDVELCVYNLLGHKVATLVNETKEAGAYEIQFDAADLPSGIYYYNLKTASQSVMKKMVLMR